MRNSILIWIIATAPIFIEASPSYDYRLEGVWQNYRHGIIFEIQPSSRNVILVRRLDSRRNSPWVSYHRTRRGSFKDAYGNSIVRYDGKLLWNRRRKKDIVLVKNSRIGACAVTPIRKRRRGYDVWQHDKNTEEYYKAYFSPNGTWYNDKYNVEIEVRDIGQRRIKVRRVGQNKRLQAETYIYSESRHKPNQYYDKTGTSYTVRKETLLFNDVLNEKVLLFERLR